MSQTQPVEPSASSFEVEIESGGRAYDAGAARDAAPRQVSPARLAAKARSRRRITVIAAVCAVGLAALAVWAWLSNPNNNIPPEAVARVNGEFIYERDINRELDLTRTANDLSKSKADDLPSRAKVLEDLISRMMQVQDAHRAGVTATPAEVDAAMKGILERTGLTEATLDVTLARYNLKADDMRGVTADVLLINKYIGDYVVKGAASDQEIQTLRNDWLTNLAQTSKIDRFRSPGTGPAPRVGSEAPDFTLKDLSGKEIKLSALRGRPVMLNFWATWCPPCRAEIPTIVQTYAETHNANAYEILGIATQSEGQTVQAFAKELGINFPVLPDAENRITDLYHVLPIPTSFFIDKDGIIREIQVGVLDRPKIEKWLLDRSAK